jgi:hypothetical protein
MKLYYSYAWEQINSGIIWELRTNFIQWIVCASVPKINFNVEQLCVPKVQVNLSAVLGPKLYLMEHDPRRELLKK